MSARLIRRTKKARRSLPQHVKSSASQLDKMEAAIRNLLAPMVDRLHVFVHPEAYEKKTKKRKKS